MMAGLANAQATGGSSSNYPVVTSMDGPAVITPDGGPYAFSLSVTNGTPPYTYTWSYEKYQADSGMTKSTVLYQGTEYSSVSFSFDQIKPANTEAGGYVEAEVTDSQGRQAMWSSYDSYYGEQHGWSFTFNYAPSQTSGNGFVLGKSPANWPYTPYIPPQSAGVNSPASDSSSSSVPSWIPLAIGVGILVVLGVGVVVVGVIAVLGILVIKKMFFPKAPVSGSPAAADNAASNSTNDDDDDNKDDKKGPAVLRLTYPCGPSPKVFTSGWLFGAECLDDKGNDMSDLVEWSGTGSFEPGTGRQSRPVFDSEGPNEITLSCKLGDNVLKQTFPLMAVSPKNYARLGSKARCMADSHTTGMGMDAPHSAATGNSPTIASCCPHIVVGPVIAGSPTVLIDGVPAARKGDPGVHASCCGPNTFSIMEGDPEVLIDGKPAARIGDKTQHCGGIGNIID